MTFPGDLLEKIFKNIFTYNFNLIKYCIAWLNSFSLFIEKDLMNSHYFSQVKQF